MGYRVNKIPLKPEDMLPTYSVRNGATLQLYFECYYMEPEYGHDPHFHDYIGWPSPTHPGSSCQMKTPRDQFRWLSDGKIVQESEPVPIDLTEEGYTTVSVVFDHPDENITATGIIDDELPYMIDLKVDVQLPMFEDKPIEKRFTLFVNRTGASDAVARAKLSILPGAPVSVN